MKIIKIKKTIHHNLFIYLILHRHDHQQEHDGFQEILEDLLNYFLRCNYVKLCSITTPLNH